jgi:hypothetical protein
MLSSSKGKEGCARTGDCSYDEGDDEPDKAGEKGGNEPRDNS